MIGRAHLDGFVDEDQDALVFNGAKGAVLPRSNFQTACKWRDYVAAAGPPISTSTTRGTLATPWHRGPGQA
ncbi:hypothetical protein ACFYL6_11860 [Micromonospora sp. NPDC007208]|uniref:hypothetical protein n=1 Tax=Micromonospora sp. NPDC007208 TaxID=3364236 RepID=UPI0036B30703